MGWLWAGYELAMERLWDDSHYPEDSKPPGISWLWAGYELAMERLWGGYGSYGKLLCPPERGPAVPAAARLRR